MSNNFPPAPTHTREIEAMVEILSSIIENRNATYLSAPITSGKRFSDWSKLRRRDTTSEDEYLKELGCHVIEPNRLHAREIARGLRDTADAILIDPTVVADIGEWNQDDYRHLWACVIERYASRVVCIDGWHYSNGCAFEFLVAHQLGIPTLSEHLSPITLEQGASLIKQAISDINSYDLPTAFLENVYEELRELCD